MYINNTLEKYIEDLSSKQPAPGGGSASACCSVLGISLLLMVSNFTVDKKGYEQYQNEIVDILEKLKEYKKRLLELIDLDVAVYQKLNSAYKLSKESDEQIKIRQETIQQTLKEAIIVPLEILDISFKGLKIAERLNIIGNKNLISDVYCGVVFLKGGLLGAKFNIDINLNSIKEEKFVNEKKNYVKKFLDESGNIVEKILEGGK